jgi:hypothetical protein
MQFTAGWELWGVQGLRLRVSSERNAKHASSTDWPIASTWTRRDKHPAGVHCTNFLHCFLVVGIDDVLAPQVTQVLQRRQSGVGVLVYSGGVGINDAAEAFLAAQALPLAASEEKSARGASRSATALSSPTWHKL